MSVFEKNIEAVNLPPLKDGDSGVIFTSELACMSSRQLSPSVLFPLETAANRFHATAVYFRYSEERKSHNAFLYIFDFTAKSYTSDEKKRIHRMMWNGSQVPGYMIVEKSSISIYSSRLNPSNNVDLAEVLSISSDAFSSFEAIDLSNGLFWERLHNIDTITFDQSATCSLIRGLKKVYHSFCTKSGLDSHIALRLLMQCILIKYLEERDENSSNGYFASHYFKDNFGCDGFCDAIRRGKLLELLDLLSEDFNGKIFEWDIVSQSEARHAIELANVNDLANYLDGNSEDNEYVLWRLYSFSFLPIEVISSVYEELLTDSKDIVYTPEMIVSTLVDECMPLDEPNIGMKLIDVSCGSGIFLVKAYKRIVQWWRYNRWKETGQLEKPNLHILKELLLQSIYGVDIEQDAVNLSIFSLALAMLDEVDITPPVWNELKFPDLGHNVSCKDFFDFIVSDESVHIDFDLVIGNPPFNLKKGSDGKELDRKQFFKDIKIAYGYKCSIPIPDEHPALHFLYSSLSLIKQGGMLCMIQPSGPLLYQDNQSFKKSLFGSNNLLQVIDFTLLDDKLWGAKTVPTVAVFIKKIEPNDDRVLHLVANRSLSNINRLFLEFDYYDFHWIGKNSVINDPFIWKSNLLGGSRVSNLLARLTQYRSLEEFLCTMKESGWCWGEGFIGDCGQKNPKLASYITNHPFIETEELVSKDKNKNPLSICTEEFFHRPRRNELYEPPHLLFRRIIPLVVCFYDEYVTFKEGVFAIHSPWSDKDVLSKIGEFYMEYEELMRFLILAMSSRVGIIKATSIYAKDVLRLPFPKDLDSFVLNDADKAIVEDSLSYYYSVRSRETQRQLYQENASVNELYAYARVFCKGLNSFTNQCFYLSRLLEIGDSYYVVKVSCTSYNEYHSDENTSCRIEKVDSMEGAIDSLLHSSSSLFSSLRIRRILRIFDHNTVVLIKPAQRRYWLRTIALRDSDELFAESVNNLWDAKGLSLR